MKLLVDIGNTNIKWRVAADTQVHDVGQWPELVSRWAQMSVTDIHASCVKGDVWRDEFAQACRTHLGIAPRFAMVRRLPGTPEIAYRDLSSFGVDRWLGLLAAAARVPAAFVLVSGGSAVTVDFVAGDGRHLGGMIVPGLAMSAAALDRGTGRIGPQQWTGLTPLWRAGENTAGCIQAGLSASYKGLLAEVCGHPVLREEGGRLILTGGDAEILRALLAPDTRVHVFPFLVLDGLQLLQPARDTDFQ